MNLKLTQYKQIYIAHIPLGVGVVVTIEPVKADEKLVVTCALLVTSLSV